MNAKQPSRNVVISNFLGIKHAEILLSNITFICGKNYQGKSSVGIAVAYALTGTILPDGVKKNTASMIVNDSADKGTITFTDPNGQSKIDYPECKATASGYPMQISEVAAGLISPAKMDAKTRSTYYSELLGTAPTIDDLKAAIASANVPEEHIDRLWNSILSIGWDGAHAHSRRCGWEMKGEWRSITGGETYGKDKAEHWNPVGWLPGMENMIGGALALDIAALRTEKDLSVGQVAVDEAELDRLTAIENGIHEAKKNLAAAKKETKKAQSKHEKLRDKNVPEPVVVQTPISCPSCGDKLMIAGETIVLHDGSNLPDTQKVRVTFDKHREILVAAGHTFVQASNKMSDCKTAVTDCEDAARDAAELRAQATEPTETSKRSPEEIDAEISSCESQINAITTYRKAYEVHERLKRNGVIVAALAPNGIRKAAVSKGIITLSTQSDSISHAANWSLVTMDDDLNVFYGGRPYSLCSKSERFRCRVILQLSSAMIDGSQVVVIDGADILDKDGRNGLIRSINKSGCSSVVCMTLKDIADVPPMSKIGGIAYWIENGTAKVV